MKTIKNPMMILGVFILFKVVQTAYAFTLGENPSYLSYLRIAGIFILVPISYLAVKRKVMALWIMSIILLSQIFNVIWAIFLIPLEQIILKAFTIVLASYFVFGGYVLIQLAKGKTQPTE